MSRAGDRHFEEFQGHTLLKHLILRNYLQAWGAKLRRPDRAIWFVDAFAGEGRDGAGNPGSPLIAAQLASSFKADGLGRMRVLAIERNRTRFSRLEVNLRPYVEARVADVRRGTLDEFIDLLMPFIGDKPALFFLDPFGVRGLFADLFDKLLAGPQNEIFALFSDVGANRLHAVLLARGRDPDAEEARVLDAPSLFPEWTHEDARRARADAEQRLRSLQATQSAATEIFAESLGPTAVEELSAIHDPEERRQRMVSMFMETLIEAGAAHVLAVPMRGKKNQRTYQLVYASKSSVGLRTMKEEVERALNGAELPEESLAAIRLELCGNEESAGAQVAAHFADRVVPWSVQDRKADTVRRYLLEHTAIFPMQCAAVRKRFSDLYPVVSKKPLTFRFPPAPPPVP